MRYGIIFYLYLFLFWRISRSKIDRRKRLLTITGTARYNQRLAFCCSRRLWWNGFFADATDAIARKSSYRFEQPLPPLSTFPVKSDERLRAARSDSRPVGRGATLHRSCGLRKRETCLRDLHSICSCCGYSLAINK